MNPLTEILERLSDNIMANPHKMLPKGELTYVEQAEAAINAYIAEVIGEDEKQPHPGYIPQFSDEMQELKASETRNQLRAEQRKRGGL